MVAPFRTKSLGTMRSQRVFATSVADHPQPMLRFQPDVREGLVIRICPLTQSPLVTFQLRTSFPRTPAIWLVVLAANTISRVAICAAELQTTCCRVTPAPELWRCFTD